MAVIDSPTLCRLPLDGTADRGDLIGWRLGAVGNRAHHDSEELISVEVVRLLGECVAKLFSGTK